MGCTVHYLHENTVYNIPGEVTTDSKRAYILRYDRRGRISAYCSVIPGSVLRSYFSVLCTMQYDDLQIFENSNE